MVMSRRASQERFENRVAQVALAAVSAVFVLIGLAGLVEPTSRGMSVLLVVVGGFSAVRALRSSAVVVDGSGVSTRSMLRTRRYAFSELRGVEVAAGRTGVTAFNREYLVFHRADCKDVGFKELNCPASKEGSATSVVRRAAACINERLSSR